MKIKYIEHSGFLVETDRTYLLFDYYMGEIPVLDNDKDLIVFVSHKHPDHYNPDIYKLLNKYPDTHFIIPKGTPVRPFIEEYNKQGIDLEQHITIIRKNENYDLVLNNGNQFTVKTLRSTDIGVAYIVGTDGKQIYHAGDLNLWLWDGESEQFINNMRNAFFREMDKLKGEKFDVAFVPLDPRLENHAFDGMEVFLEYTDTDKVYPMHMWKKYGIIDKFIDKHPEYKDNIVDIKYSGQEWSN